MLDRLHEAAGRSLQDLDQVKRSAITTVEAVKAADEQLGQAMKRIMDRSNQVAEIVGSVSLEVVRSGESIDELIQNFRDAGGQHEVIAQQIEAVRLGLVTVQELRAALPDTRFGAELLADVLDRLNVAALEDEVQNFAARMQQERLSVDEILSFMIERGGFLGGKIAEWADALRSNRITLEEFLRIAENLREAAKGTVLDDVLEGLEQGLQREREGF